MSLSMRVRLRHPVAAFRATTLTAVDGAAYTGGRLIVKRPEAHRTFLMSPSMSLLQCLFCKHFNPAGAAFCNGCGSPMDLQPCEACAAIDKRTARHCYKCGAEFLPLPAPDLLVESLADEIESALAALDKPLLESPLAPPMVDAVVDGEAARTESPRLIEAIAVHRRDLPDGDEQTGHREITPGDWSMPPLSSAKDAPASFEPAFSGAEAHAPAASASRPGNTWGLLLALVALVAIVAALAYHHQNPASVAETQGSVAAAGTPPTTAVAQAPPAAMQGTTGTASYPATVARTSVAAPAADACPAAVAALALCSVKSNQGK